MAEEWFKDTTALFGEDAVERIKKRHDALKTLRTIKQLFQKGDIQRTSCYGHCENQSYTNSLGSNHGQPKDQDSVLGKKSHPKKD